MKFSFLSFCAGVLCTSMIFSCGVTAYASYKKTATLDYPGIKIMVDGQQITPKNASGKTVEPFAIDGTTYLPVRAVSNALGMNVDWNAATKSVVITSDSKAADLLKYYKLLEEDFSFLYEHLDAISSDRISMYTNKTEISGTTYANAMKSKAQVDLATLESWYQHCYSAGYLSDEAIAFMVEYRRLNGILCADIDKLQKSTSNAASVKSSAGNDKWSAATHETTSRSRFWTWYDNI